MSEIVTAYKTVQFRIRPTAELLVLMKDFRDMTNDAIAVGLERHVKSRFALIREVYEGFKRRYGLQTHYIYGACEVAYSIIKKHRKWHRRPVSKHLMLKLDNQTYNLSYMLLKIPSRPCHHVLIPLVGGDYQNSFLRSDGLRRGSVTITPNTASISYSRCVEISQPRVAMAYDTNVKSMVGFASDGRVERHDLSVVARIRTESAERRAEFNAKHSNDRRVASRACRRIGKRERERVKRILHEVSKAVVQSAKKEGGAIILERLTHILSPRNGRKRGRTTKVMLHRWSFGELHRQIKYKAAWDGVPMECVNPWNTSKKCSQCGRLNRALRNERMWRCPSCGATHDRDVNAAKNVLALSKLGCQLLVPAGAPGR